MANWAAAIPCKESDVTVRKNQRFVFPCLANLVSAGGGRHGCHHGHSHGTDDAADDDGHFSEIDQLPCLVNADRALPLVIPQI